MKFPQNNIVYFKSMYDLNIMKIEQTFKKYVFNDLKNLGQ